MKWEDPTHESIHGLPRGRKKTETEKTFSTLRANPGRWAVIRESETKSRAASYGETFKRSCKTYGVSRFSIETAYERFPNESGTFNTYARYLALGEGVTPSVTFTDADLSDPDKAVKPGKQAGSEPV